MFYQEEFCSNNQIPSSWTETEGTNYAWLNIRGNIHEPQAGSSHHLQEELVSFERSRVTYKSGHQHYHQESYLTTSE